MKSTLLLVVFFIIACSCADYNIWTGSAQNEWTVTFFSGTGEAGNTVHTADGNPSIYFQVIQWGGITLRHDYSYVSIKDYLYLNFEFYWEDPSSDFGLEVRVKTEGEEWTVPIAVGNFTSEMQHRGEWNKVSLNVDELNPASLQINQIQIQKTDLIPVDAWIDSVAFGNTAALGAVPSLLGLLFLVVCSIIVAI